MKALKSKWKNCPMCYSEKISRVIKDIECIFKDKKIIVPNIEFDECVNCKERLYDANAMKLMDEFISHNIRKVA